MRADDPRFEKEISRRLSGLPELSAPESLIANVLQRIEHEAAQPWYRKSWQTWPIVPQTIAVLVFAALFWVISFGVWSLLQAESLSIAVQQVRTWLAGVATTGEAIGVVLNALVRVVKSIGPWFIAFCILAWAASYAACVGLGTMFVRFAFIRRKDIRL